MTENLGPAPETDEEREGARSPAWIAPIATWLASEESAAVTGRVFEASGQFLAVAEGWVRGPSTEPVDDPTKLGPIVADLLAKAPPTRASTAIPADGRNRRPDPDRRAKGPAMPLNPDAVGSKGEPVEVSWTSKDCLLYAVGIGAGTHELPFTTENTNDVQQLVFPTFPVVIGWGKGSAMGKIGSFNPALLVHGQQSVTLHRRSGRGARRRWRARSPGCTTRARRPSS